MMAVKPILFNTEMVRAILDERKSVTRRVVKDSSNRTPLSMNRPNLYKMTTKLNGKPYFGAGFYGDMDVFTASGRTLIDARYFRSTYQPGDILWVRETFLRCFMTKFLYKADDSDGAIERAFIQQGWNWIPSIHMPREAARIFLRVTNVLVGRLKDMTANQAIDEGFVDWNDAVRVWDSTIKKADLPLYGWGANPWVWVIEFERCEKPEGWCK